MSDSIKILVVDDTPANLEVVTETLSLAGYATSTAISGERALKRLQTYIPDLILLDVQMPGMDGFETCQQLKANPVTAHIPVIFMTALTDIDSKVKGFSLGAVDYITKPFQEAELLARVNTHLQLSSLTKQLERRVEERTAELQLTLDQLSRSQLQLIQAEKMAALGNLVAGVAHEINNPIGFLSGSIRHTKDYAEALLEHLSLYQQQYPQAVPLIQEHADDIDLEFLSEDFPKVLASMKKATEWITSISNNLRTFSRADVASKVRADLHEGLDSTLMILKYRLKANEFRPAIEVIKDYGDIPVINCCPGQLNQVFMNILANAIDMFDDMAQGQSFDQLTAHPQEITIRTTADANQVQIQISDNGKGMTEEVRERIFDHLFTTKDVDKGTGLGLTIARQIVIDKHSGSLEVQSTPGEGTEFCIRLPIAD
ncbi:response regulator [Limnothrix sp. FACHB-708]|uniref:sensor histidine kinase n=1 Tax=unclassified Limnothrix TaxID=2632864 RepID=UPI00168685B5|nr:MULTISPECIES: response regulator [unclassified Limnothrix]MBD2552282.1 response regulator [Limnothrix sp. FACHB-708]MBD2590149.1 response regulator [Limnothrix sp. FACHB-406]